MGLPRLDVDDHVEQGRVVTDVLHVRAVFPSAPDTTPLR